jgi:hypothetical protein
MALRCWLVLSAMLCMEAFADQPPPMPNAPQSDSSDVPDDGFIEFLGDDDVGDAAWWEFLKKTTPRKESPPPEPPQDASP